MRHLFIYIVFTATFGVAQTHYYNLKSEIPQKYQFNADSIYKELLKTKDASLTESSYKEYCQNMVFYHKMNLSSGNIYFNWIEIEDYINKLLSKILEINHITKKFTVFITRNEDANASAQDNGFIYVNIGLLAELTDEAALVEVLGHEVSHAINTDAKKSFIKKTSSKDYKLSKILNNSHNNRKLEAIADSFGFNTAVKLNYNLNSSYQTFMKFESDYKWFKSQYSYQNPKWYVSTEEDNKKLKVDEDSLEIYLSDHPENNLRINHLTQTIKTLNGKFSYLENEKTFKAIQQKARVEQLYLDFSKAAYKNCLRNAFYYHLKKQDDSIYLYYITECLRRLILIDPAIKHKGFLTEDSKESIFEKNKGILSDFSFISLDTTFIRELNSDKIYGAYEKPFETYQKAYNFYIKLAKNYQTETYYLNIGLNDLVKNKPENAKENFYTQQLLKSNIETDYIKTLQSGNLMDALKNNTNDLVYIEPVDYYILENKHLKYDIIESKNSSEALKMMLEHNLKINENINPIPLFADTLNITDFNLYDNLSDQLKVFKPQKELDYDYASKGSYMDDENYWQSLSKTEPLNIDLLKRNKNFFYLHPEYWLLFKDKKIKSFTVLKPVFYKHPVLGKLFYFEIYYFNPITKNYCHFEQEYAEKYNDGNIKKVLKQFTKKINK